MTPLLLRYPPRGTLPEGVLDVSAGDAAGADRVLVGGGAPVVCLHGTVASGGNWGKLASLLLGAGRVVVAPTYGERGTRPLANNLAEVTGIVRRTLEVTGADRVDLVGHSQGGLLAGMMVAGMLRGEPPLPPGSIGRVVCVSGSHRGVVGPRGAPARIVDAIFGPALTDQMRLRRRGGVPAVVAAVAETRPLPRSLPAWFDLVSDADRIVPADCALTDAEYPGARTIRLEERIGRGVGHRLQPHDVGVVKLIAELLRAPAPGA